MVTPIDNDCKLKRIETFLTVHILMTFKFLLQKIASFCLH